MLSFAAVLSAAAAIWLFREALLLADVSAANSSTNYLVGPYFTAASIFAASAGWLVSNAVTTLLKTRDKASDFIRVAQADPDFIAALAYVANVAYDPNNIERFADERARKAFYEDPASETFRNNLRKSHNVFDEMAIFIRRGAADEAILRDFYLGMLVRLYRTHFLFRPYITNIPKTQDGRPQRPEVVVNVDWLYARWERYYRDTFFYGYGPAEVSLENVDYF